jgi:hypothetical protein
MLRILHFLDDMLNMVVKLLASRAGCALLSRDIFISVSDIHFCCRLSKSQGLVLPDELGKLMPFNYLPASCPACSVVPQSLRYRVAHPLLIIKE